MSKPREPGMPSEGDKANIHQRFEEYLGRLGLRQTKQRRVILDAVMALGGDHVDAEAIAAQARRVDKSIGLATVYRTLQLMTDCGILLERQFGRERAQFEVASTTDEHHDHLICADCGAIVEFYDEEIEQLQEDIAARLGFRLAHHRMELFARCLNPKDCDRKRTKELNNAR